MNIHNVDWAPQNVETESKKMYVGFTQGKTNSSWWVTTHIQVEGSLYFVLKTDFDTENAFWAWFSVKYQHWSQMSTKTLKFFAKLTKIIQFAVKSKYWSKTRHIQLHKIV
jgi:hypothetical protein